MNTPLEAPLAPATPGIAEITAREQAPQTSLREELWVHPSRVWLRSTRIGSRLSHASNNAMEVLDTAYEEVADGSAAQVAGATALVGAVVGTQALDRVRIIIQQMPPRATDLMVNMEFNEKSSIAAGALVGIAFGLWNFTASEVLNWGLDKFPKATEKFTQNYPRITKAAQSAIPHKEVEKWESGRDNTLEAKKSDQIESKTLRERSIERIKKIGSVVLGSKDVKEHLGRGALGTALGSTIYMGVAATEKVPRKHRTRINYEVSRDASLFLTGVITGVAELVRRSVINGSPERAQTIISWAGGGANWNWFAAGIVGLTAGLNYGARKKVATVKSGTENAGYEFSE